MKCPNKDCQGEIMFKETLEGGNFKKKFKKLIYFCPLCDWENIKRFQITNLEFQKEIEKTGNNKILKFE